MSVNQRRNLNRFRGGCGAALFVAVGVVSRLDDVPVVGEAVEHGGGLLGVTKDLGAFAEGEVTDHNHASWYLHSHRLCRRLSFSSIGLSFIVCLAAPNVGSLIDSSICQTSTVISAEPGGDCF